MTDDARPDPDRLLERLKQEEARARRGKLKIFFGASAGVGKTYLARRARIWNTGEYRAPASRFISRRLSFGCWRR
jgi:hypothetical protein